MPSLARTLQDLDLGHLRVIAELWGLDPPDRSGAAAAASLAGQMLDPALAAEIVQALPGPSRESLDFLLERGGRAAVAELGLRFGPLRIVGPGRRDRERPWRDTSAALGGLWYRGLIGLAFYETPTGPQEFAFLPDDLQDVVRPLGKPSSGSASASPPPTVVSKAGGAADDAVTLLAALRRRPARSGLLPADRSSQLKRFLVHPGSLALLLALLRDLNVLIAAPLRPDPNRTRELLVGPRAGVEARLRQVWRRTAANDLASIPGLTAPKGKWPNDPVTTRNALLAVVGEWPAQEWFSIEGLVATVRERHPAFLRPGGDFDSWYLQDGASGRFLRGVENWEMVEGALLRHTIAGPLHWLGAVDLGAAEEGSPPTHFRLRPGLGDEPSRMPDPGAATEPPTARVSPHGRVLFPIGSSLTQRYQVARFAEWVNRDSAGYAYRITPRGLAAAASQGLEARRVVAVLETACRRQLPAPLRRAIDRWSERGAEAALESTTLLRVQHPSTLRQLRADPATGRFLEEIIGPAVARIRSRDVETLLAAAARRGLLIDPPEEQ